MHNKTIFSAMSHAVSDIMSAIQHHPFNVELSQGTLAHEKFICYLVQDALYLADYSRALALAAAKLAESHHTQQFMHFALGALQAERDLHLNYLQKYQIKLQDYQMNPACFMYTNYLLKTATLSSVEEAVASLLPCFWVYREVGKQMQTSQTGRANPYRDWIEIYSGEPFAISVELALEIMNQLGEKASPIIKEKMIAAFTKATELEWLFWDNAYQLQQGITNFKAKAESVCETSQL